MRLQMGALKLCFLCRVQRLSCGDKGKSSDIWREPRLHLLHPHIKRSQSGSFGYLIVLLSRCLSLEVVQVNSPERGPQGRSRACRRDYLIWHANARGTSGGAGKHFCENDCQTAEGLPLRLDSETEGKKLHKVLNKKGKCCTADPQRLLLLHF